MNYSKARPHIPTGDFFGFCGTGPVARGIQLYQRAKGYKYWWINHTALAVRTDIGTLKDKVFIVEAVGQGLVPRQLSRVWMNHGRVFWCHAAGMTPEQRMRILEIAIDYGTRGIKYDYRGCFANLIRRVSTDAEKFYCSEFTWWAHRAVGYAVAMHNHNPTPAQQPEWEHIIPIELNMAA